MREYFLVRLDALAKAFHMHAPFYDFTITQSMRCPCLTDATQEG